jgi:hypothetical protein
MKGIPMKKLVLVAFLLLALQLAPAAATPLDELTQLAGYFPDDTQVFAAVRIDDDFIATLDELIARLDDAVPGLFGDSPSLRAALDEASQRAGQQMTQEDDEDFESLFRSWLGDTAALAIDNTGTAMFGGEVRPLIALAITDRDAAEAFIDDYIVPNGAYDKAERYGGILYEAQNSFNSHYLLLDDVLLGTLTGRQPARTLNLRVRESLAESDAFTEALATLPADEYNIVVYANLPEILAPFAAFAPSAVGEDVPLDLMPAVEGLGAITVGFTIIEEQSLVMDVGLVVDDPDVFREAGLRLGNLPAIDLDFAAYAPANTAVLIQNQDFGGELINLIDRLDEIGTLLEAMEMYPLIQGTRNPPYSQAELDVLQSVNLNDVATFIRQSFRGMTGLTLEEGLGWMSADYAAYLGYSLPDPETLSVSLGVISAVTDTEAAEAFRDGVQAAFDQGGVAYSTEGDNLVLPFLSQAVEEGTGRAAPEFDFVLGLNDDVMVLGTRPSTDHALDPQDGGLAGTSAYQNARRAFVTDSHLLWYLSLPSLLNPARETLIAADASAEQLYGLVDLFESLSITAASDENGTGVVRFAITLSE